MRNHRSKCLWENSFGGQPCGIGVWWYILFTRIQFHFIYAIILTGTVWLRSVCKCMLLKQIYRDYSNALSWYKIDCIRCWLCGTDKHFSVWHDYDGFVHGCSCQQHRWRHNNIQHDDVIKWKHFPRYWPFVWGIHRSPVNSPHKGQWRWASMFFFYLRLNKRLSKQLRRQWFETPSCSL